tara:strand:+ start:974 stop:2815 length:1842 start_codon:yes stop_codon:yes gene_type:complete
MSYKKDAVTNDNIGELVRMMETNYVNGQISQSKYVQVSMYEDIQKIDAYLNSKHTSGEKDSLDRDKPFFNIVTAAANIWYRSTDIDRKNIKIRASKNKDTINAFLATIHIQDWMRRENYGSFLNDWGRVLSRYGSAVVKHVEKEGRLIPSVIPWQRIIVDPVDFDANPKIELLELTEAQLYERKGYDKDMVDKLCDAKKARELVDGHNIDNRSEYIKLYEIHGNLPKSYLTGKDKDDDIFVQQMHVISFVASKEDGKFDDFTLVSGQEAKDPYMITHLIKEDGQTLSMGAVRHLFDAQWMMNHTVKAIKDQLDLASKLIFQTSDGSFVGQNALSAIETGDILIHAPNQPITQVQNDSHDITALQNQGTMWSSVKNEIVGISESMLGNAAPSGTAWRQVEALLQQNTSLFELMTENKALHIEDMFRTYVIPHIKKKMDTSEEVSATLEDNDITKIDGKFIKNLTPKIINNAIKNKILYGNPDDLTPVTPEEQAMVSTQVAGKIQEGLQENGNQRFFKPDEIDTVTWKEAFDGMEWDLIVDITEESESTKDELTTLTTIFQTIADPAKNAILSTPEGKMLFNKIITRAGSVSPLELNSTPSPVQTQLAPPPTAVQ